MATGFLERTRTSTDRVGSSVLCSRPAFNLSTRYGSYRRISTSTFRTSRVCAPPSRQAKLLTKLRSECTAPRLIEVDNPTRSAEWDSFAQLPLSQRTTVLSRRTFLDWGFDNPPFPMLHLLLDNCGAFIISEMLPNYPQLEGFVSYESLAVDCAEDFAWLPSSLRRIHILQKDYSGFLQSPEEIAHFPLLESLTFTWLQPDAGESHSGVDPLAEVSDPFCGLRQHVESAIVAPQCTVK